MLIDRSYKPWLVVDEKDSTRPALTHALVVAPGYHETSDALIARAAADERNTIDANGLLVGSDGFAMVVLPIVLQSDDVPGVVRLDALRRATKIKTSHDGTHTYGSIVRVDLLGDALVLGDGTSMPRANSLLATAKRRALTAGAPRNANGDVIVETPEQQIARVDGAYRYPHFEIVLGKAARSKLRGEDSETFGAIALNGRFLHDVASAIGSDGIRLSFGATNRSIMLIEPYNSDPLPDLPAPPFGLLMPMYGF